MSTEWNNKLALSLRDPADPALEILPSSSLRAALLSPDSPTSLPESDARQAWASSAGDRAPASLLAQSAHGAAAWSTSCEVSHPLSGERASFGTVDLDDLRAKASALAAEAAKRFGDTRERWLWTWRYLEDRLASDLGAGARAARLAPADPRMPDLSVWSRIAFDGALATASPAPTFLVAHVEPAVFDATRPPSDRAYCAALRLHAHLCWQSALAVVDALGPDAILSPSLRQHPLCDAWLGEQKVTARKGDPAAGAPSFASFPSTFAALVPQARAQELGDACAARARSAWSAIASGALDRLATLGGKISDDTFKAIWSRQVDDAWQPGWVAMPWLDDSTGAGGLLPKQDVAAQEKWAKAQQDASGLEDPWPGTYFGLWYLATWAASDARRLRCASVRAVEPGPRCTSCGERQALHAAGDGAADALVKAFWDAVTDSKSGAVFFDAGEQLCACCAATRLWDGAGAAPTQTSSRFTLVVFAPDQSAIGRRGGRDLKQNATISALVHPSLAEPAGKARGALKDVLDGSPVLGPARLMSTEAAFASHAWRAIPALVEQVGGAMVYSVIDEQIAVVPTARALELIRSVRERLRAGFFEADGRMVVQAGASYAWSAVLMAAEPGAPLGRLVRAGRSLLQTVARDTLGGDACVLAVHEGDAGAQALGVRSQELDPVVGELLAAFPSRSDWTRMVRALLPIESALGSPDVDKPAPDTRASLVRDALSRAGLKSSGGALPTDDLCRALCVLIDRAVAQGDGDAQRAMDGLLVAASLAGGDR